MTAQIQQDQTVLDFHEQLKTVLPRLRIYALSLTRDRDAADDLVHDTVVKALTGRHSFQPGTNLAACMHLAQSMQAHGETGSIITLLCDRGERYAETLFDDTWLAAHGIDPARSQAQLSSRLLAA